MSHLPRKPWRPLALVLALSTALFGLAILVFLGRPAEFPTPESTALAQEKRRVQRLPIRNARSHSRVNIPSHPATNALAPTAASQPIPSPSVDPGMAAPSGVEEAALAFQGQLMQVNGSRDLKHLTGWLADDPELRSQLGELTRTMRNDRDPETRARGILIQTGLGLLEGSRWLHVLDREAEASVRARMLQSLPSTDNPAWRQRFREELLVRAGGDSAPEVRRAAIETLPADLNRDEIGALLSILSKDPDPSVRETTAHYFQGSGRVEPEVLCVLLEVGNREGESPAVRRTALFAALEAEKTLPGVLARLGVDPKEIERRASELISE